MGYAIIFLAMIAIFVVGIIFFAGRSARKGRRYIGVEDPIQRYEDRVEGNWSFHGGISSVEAPREEAGNGEYGLRRGVMPKKRPKSCGRQSASDVSNVNSIASTAMMLQIDSILHATHS